MWESTDRPSKTMVKVDETAWIDPYAVEAVWIHNRTAVVELSNGGSVHVKPLRDTESDKDMMDRVMLRLFDSTRLETPK